MTEFKIDHLGRQGDGIATENGKPVYIPFSLPGEAIKVSGKGPRREISEIVEISPDRIEPVCQHFGACGGCQAQHISETLYQNWKTSLVAESLNKAGIDCLIDPLVTFETARRRKCVFNIRNGREGVIVGFSEASSDKIVPIKECPVLVPEISERLADFRELCASLPQAKKPYRLSILDSQNGLDLSFEGTLPLKREIREIMIRKSLSLGFARLSWNGEVLIEQKKPTLQMSRCAIIPPPGAFVQAVEAAEQSMAALVSNHLSDCKSVADLFCGIGTFALRLAENSTVWAVEENAPALESLDRAWRETGGKLKQVKTEARNLDRRPANFQELKKIDGLVFDPPRAGAEMQAKQISKSKVKKVAAVSCNPVTLARDLQILIDGGYKVASITPIDQFKFTPHVEVVALLER